MSARGGGRGYFDEESGHFYHLRRKYDDGSIALTCCKKKLKKDPCNGTATLLTTGVYVSKQPHNHEPNKKIIQEKELKKNIRKAVTVPGVKKVKEVFDKVCQSDVEAAQNLDYESMRGHLFALKAETKPVKHLGKCYKVQLLHEKIQTGFVKYEYGKKKYEFSSILVPAEKPHCLFFDPDFVKLFEDVEFTLHGDGTFDTVPKLAGTTQLVTFMAQVDGKAYPLAYAFMSDKTEESYVRVLTELKNRFPRLQPSMAITDFETALQNAITRVFGIKVIGCHFHLGQAVFKNAKLKGVALKKFNKRDSPEKHKLIKKFINLAYLPKELVPEGLSILEQECAFKFPGQFDDFIEYFKRQWIVSVGADTFCVYRMKVRTNNFQESYHKVLKDMLGKRPSITCFMNEIVNYTCKMRLQFAQTKSKKRRSEYVDRDKELFEAWDNLDTGKWSIKHFLNKVSHFDEEIDDDIAALLDAPLVIVLSGLEEISPEVLTYANESTFLRYETRVIQLQDEEEI